MLEKEVWGGFPPPPLYFPDCLVAVSAFDERGEDTIWGRTKQSSIKRLSVLDKRLVVWCSCLVRISFWHPLMSESFVPAVKYVGE